MIQKGSAAKRHRQNQKRRLRNRIVRSSVKTCIRKYVAAVQENKKEEAEASYKVVISELDTAVSKGVFHKNTAARKKSRLHKLLQKVGA